MSKEKPRGKSVKFPKGNFHLKQGDYVVVIIDEPISVGSPESEWIVGAKVRAGNILLAELDEKDSKQSTLKITKKYKIIVQELYLIMVKLMMKIGIDLFPRKHHSEYIRMIIKLQSTLYGLY